MQRAKKANFRPLYLLFILSVLGVGCSSFTDLIDRFKPSKADYSVAEINADYALMDQQIGYSDSILAFYGPYKAQLDSVMQRPLAVLREPLKMQRGKASSSLANVLADMLRAQASAYKKDRIDIALLNRGGIRLPELSDTVRVGTLFELMPFENTLTFMTLSGQEVHRLAQELAAVGGEAVSGIRFSIQDKKAIDILVGNEPLNTQKNYQLVTNNYLVQGGGDMPVLWQAEKAEFSPILLRDLYINAFKGNMYISPIEDERIRILDAS
jgi:2',3'-cyclic-nucleotide 2'-phosphodiesterase (5'-nucleotidase family)